MIPQRQVATTMLVPVIDRLRERRAIARIRALRARTAIWLPHFKRQFNLADYVQVKGATFDNGLLKIELVREIPEAMKPRRIAINGASGADNVHQIEAKAA
jgi:hypothetical protein